jgi:hypothetical protein
MFARYGAKQNILENADFQKISQQLARNLPGPTKIEHVFRLSRRDLRDVPDIYTKDDLARGYLARGPESDVQVSATAGDPETAIRLAKLAMGFTRDILAATALRSIVRQWGGGARTELALAREKIAKLQSAQNSLDRRIEDMEKLRERYKDEKDSVASSSASTPVQVQVSGARNLSPLQQMIGLEAERVEIKEQLRLEHQEQSRLQTVIRFSDQFEARVNDGASIVLAKEILTHTKQVGPARGNEENLPVERALAAISSQMQSVLGRFDETKIDTIEPAARIVGIRRTIAMLLGLVAAAAVWLGLVLVLPAPRSNPDGAT